MIIIMIIIKIIFIMNIIKITIIVIIIHIIQGADVDPFHMPVWRKVVWTIFFFIMVATADIGNIIGIIAIYWKLTKLENHENLVEAQSLLPSLLKSFKTRSFNLIRSAE